MNSQEASPVAAGRGTTLHLWNWNASLASTLRLLRKLQISCSELSGQSLWMILCGACGLRIPLRQSIIHDKGQSTIGNRRQLLRLMSQDEAWGSMAIGRRGTRVSGKVGTVGGSPSVHASSKTLAGSKSSSNLPSTI